MREGRVEEREWREKMGFVQKGQVGDEVGDVVMGWRRWRGMGMKS